MEQVPQSYSNAKINTSHIEIDSWNLDVNVSVDQQSYETERKKVVMENNLDLNENELDYYEQMVNDLAARLETVSREKEDMEQAIENLNSKVLESDNKCALAVQNLAAASDENSQLRQRLEELTAQFLSVVTDRGTLMDSVNLFLRVWQNYFGESWPIYSEKELFRTSLNSIDQLTNCLSEVISVINESNGVLHRREKDLTEETKQKQIEAQAKQLHRLQDLNHELKVKVEVFQRDNGLLQQEIQLLKQIAENSSNLKSENEAFNSWMSDELKILDLSASLKELKKQNNKLLTEREHLESEVTLKNRFLEEIQKEADGLRGSLQRLQADFDSARITLVKYESASKFRQLDQDEAFENMKTRLISDGEALADLQHLLKMKEIELAESNTKLSSIQFLFTKLLEKEETNERLIFELRNQNASSEREKHSIILYIKQFFESQLSQFHIGASQRLDKLTSRIVGSEKMVRDKVKQLKPTTLVNERFKVNEEMTTVRSEIRELKKKNHTLEGKIAEHEETGSLQSLLAASEKRLELISADYARTYAQNSKVFAYLESECARLKGLCDHLRGINSKINAELKKAMVIENRNKSLEQKLKFTVQSESAWMDKCKRLEFSLTQKNEEVLQLLRNQEEREESRVSSLENELETYKKLSESAKQQINKLENLNQELKMKLHEINLVTENEKKLLGHKLESSLNDILMLKRVLSEKEIETSAVKARLDEQSVRLVEVEMKLSLLSEETKLIEDSSQRTVSEFMVDIDEKGKKIEQLTKLLQQTKHKLHESETSLMTSKEEYAKLLFKLTEKEESISDLRKTLEKQSQQIQFAEDNCARFQNENIAKVKEIKDLLTHLEKLDQIYQNELHQKIELEGLLRISEEQCTFQKEKLSSTSKQLLELQEHLSAEETRKQQMQEHLHKLEEDLEYLQAANSSLTTLKEDLTKELHEVLEVKSRLESEISSKKLQIADLEDKLFDAELRCKQYIDQIDFKETKLKSLLAVETVVADRVRSVGEIIVRLANFDYSQISEILTVRKQSKKLEDGDLLGLNFFAGTEFLNLEDYIDLLCQQMLSFIAKSNQESAESEQTVIAFEHLKLTHEKVKSELEQMLDANNTIQKELSLLQTASIEEKDKTQRLKAALNDVIFRIHEILAKKYSEVVSISRVDSVGITTEFPDIIPNQDLLFMVSSCITSVTNFADQNLNLVVQLVNKFQQFELESTQSVSLCREQISLLSNEKDVLYRTLESLRFDFNVISRNFSDCKRSLDEVSSENRDLRSRFENQESQYSELEKEYSSTASMNLELVQSLAEAETLCSELRNNLKIAESQLEESCSLVSQLQYQLNLLQKRCADGEMRLETISFSFKRLKVEKETLESVKANLEVELDRLSSQESLRSISNGNELCNSFIFDIEKIYSVLSSILNLASAEENAVTTFDGDSIRGNSTADQVIAKLEKLRSWIKASLKEKISGEKEAAKVYDTLNKLSLEMALKSEEFEKLRGEHLELNDTYHQVRKNLEETLEAFNERTAELDEAKTALSHLNITIEDISRERHTLEAENRKLDSDLKRARNEICLREESITRLKQEIDSSRLREDELNEELSMHLIQLESAKVNNESMLSTIYQLEQQLEQEKTSRSSIEEQFHRLQVQERAAHTLQDQIEKLRSQLADSKRDCDTIRSDKVNAEEANLLLRKELEITRSKACTLEQHVALVQQEKSVFLDEINETRRKIQIAKENFELEKAQRIKSEATAAALKQAQSEGRVRLTDLHQTSTSETVKEENDWKELKVFINQLKSDLEEKNAQLVRERLERAELESNFQKLKQQLIDRTAELKTANAYSSNLRLEGKIARQQSLETLFILRELVNLCQIDCSHDSSVEQSAMNEENYSISGEQEEKSLKLIEALGIQELHSTAQALKQSYLNLRRLLRGLHQRASSLVATSSELNTLKLTIDQFQTEREKIENSYLQEIRTLQSQLNQLRTLDFQNSTLIQKVQSLETSLKQERDQKESFLSELMEMIAKSSQSSNGEELQSELKANSSELSRLRLEVATLQGSNDDMKKEIEAISHHRTVLKAVIEDLEIQIQNSGDKQKSNSSTDLRYLTEDDVTWEISRLKQKVSSLTEICRTYRNGICALHSKPSESSSLNLIQRDALIQSMYDEEIRLLDLRIDELQTKLRQYRKYGLEVRKQFEEMLKSIHRIGKHPAMDIAIRQIEHLRSQLEETQDYICSLQDEASHDRKFYRGRLNSFVEKLSQLESISHCCNSLTDQLKRLDFKSNPEISELCMDLSQLTEKISNWKRTPLLLANLESVTAGEIRSVNIAPTRQDFHRDNPLTRKATLRISHSSTSNI